ncbi:MAG: LON peptidase substrate-binding domain-containing protein, partial [Calditrichia bacterium]|nr:LON peptidase substrate-binding domain-containing protein [Calditrichia bacterium]
MPDKFESVAIPSEISLLPVRNTVFFPNQFLPLSVGREKSLRLLKDSVTFQEPIGIISQKDGTIDDPSVQDLYQYGTIARILKVIDLPDGSKSAFIQGISRFKLKRIVNEDPYFKAEVEIIADTMPEEENEIKIDAYLNNVRQLFEKTAEMSPEISNEHIGIVENLKEPGVIADMVMAYTHIPVDEKQQVLEKTEVLERLKKVAVILGKHVQTLELGKKIQHEIQDEMSKNQREMYLRQQIKAIQKELGEMEDVSDVGELKKKMDETKLPEEIKKVADKELDRLSRMHPSS